MAQVSYWVEQGNPNPSSPGEMGFRFWSAHLTAKEFLGPAKAERS